MAKMLRKELLKSIMVFPPVVNGRANGKHETEKDNKDDEP